jgi:hypothetical protein
MADKAYEIVSWPASEEYLKDPGAMTEPFTYAVGRKGVTTFVCPHVGLRTMT